MAQTIGSNVSSNPDDFIYTFNGVTLRGLVKNGDAVDSAPLFEGTDDVEGTGGEVCFGSSDSTTEILTISVLPGSSADQILRRFKNAGTVGPFSIRNRNHRLGQNSYFSDCARVKGSNRGSIRVSNDKTPTTYTLTVTNPISNDLFVNSANTGPLGLDLGLPSLQN